MTWTSNWIQLLKQAELQRNCRKSRTELEAMQQQKFRRLLAYVNQHSAYYRQLIRDLKLDIHRCRPQDFPVLTKTELMANFDQIATDPALNKAAVTAFLERSRDPNEYFLDRYKVIHTSGSSGEVGIFVYSRTDWARGIMQSNRLRSLPSPFKPVRVAFYGAIDGHYAGVTLLSTAQEGLNRWLFRPLALDINSPLSDVVEQLNQFQPDLLYGYTSGVGILAEQQQQGRLNIAPTRIELGGESVLETDKQWLQQVFGAEVYNVYACSEHLILGSSRPNDSRLTLWEDDLMFELASDHCCVTNLFNYSLPLIRYRMNDLLVPAESQATDWPYQQIGGLVGRVEQTPWFLNRHGQLDFISPHSINEIFVPGIRRFQLQLQSSTHFRFRVCLETNLSDTTRAQALRQLRARLLELLQRKAMERVTFVIDCLTEIPLDPVTRKFRLIVPADPALSDRPAEQA